MERIAYCRFICFTTHQNSQLNIALLVTHPQSRSFNPRTHASVEQGPGTISTAYNAYDSWQHRVNSIQRTINRLNETIIAANVHIFATGPDGLGLSVANDYLFQPVAAELGSFQYLNGRPFGLSPALVSPILPLCVPGRTVAECRQTLLFLHKLESSCVARGGLNNGVRHRASWFLSQMR